MPVVEINRDPSRSELRWFGLIGPAFFVVLGGLLYWQLMSPLPAQVAWIVGAAFALVYVSLPPLRRPLYLAWMHAVAPIGWLVSHGLLAAIYYGLITPVGLSLRFLRGDPLKRAPDSSAASYWSERDPAVEPARYLRQS